MGFFDLEYALRSNRDIQRRLGDRLKNLSTLSREPARRHPQTPAKKRQLVQDLLKICHYNTVLLTSYYFPRFFENKPLSYSEYIQSVPLFSMMPGGSLTVRAGRGISKSVSLGARQRMNAHIYSGLHSMYVTPRADQVKTYADSFRVMERAFRYPVTDVATYRQNMKYKEYPNNAIVQMFHCLTSAENARGKHGDECLTGDTLIPVRTGDGWVQRLIALVEPGDVVLSWDPQLGCVCADRVVRTKAQGLRPVWRVVTEDGHVLKCTSNEKLYTDDHGLIYLAQLLTLPEASRCRNGAAIHRTEKPLEHPVRLLTPTGSTGIRSIDYTGERDVFDIETETHHNFYANGLLVSNCLIDEAQGFDANLFTELAECFKDSKLAMFLFTGTSTTTDTFLEAKFEASSRGYWVMPCPECGHANVPVPEYNVMDMIQPDGPACVKCLNVRNRTTLLNVKHGFWDFQSRKALEQGFWGFHIPQIVVPAVVSNEKRWSSIYQLAKGGMDADPKKLYQEILGIPQEEGLREISLVDLENICTLGTDIRALEEKARKRKYRFVVSGCDWGGSDYSREDKTKVSYTVHVMMGITREGRMEIIHMHQYGGMMYEEIIEHILNKHQDLRGDAIASDFGAGQYYNAIIRNRIHQDRHFVLDYSGNISKIIDMPSGGWSQHMYNMYIINRNETLSQIFTAIKKQRILCYDWSLANARLRECLNSFRHMHETKMGKKYFSFVRHGSKPDDTLHAINFAYIMGRIMLREPMFDDKLLAKQIDQKISQPGAKVGMYSGWGGSTSH